MPVKKKTSMKKKTMESTAVYEKRMKVLNKKAQKPMYYKHGMKMLESKLTGRAKFKAWHKPNLTNSEANELYDYKYGLTKRAKKE